MNNLPFWISLCHKNLWKCRNSLSLLNLGLLNLQSGLALRLNWQNLFYPRSNTFLKHKYIYILLGFMFTLTEEMHGLQASYLLTLRYYQDHITCVILFRESRKFIHILLCSKVSNSTAYYASREICSLRDRSGLHQRRYTVVSDDAESMRNRYCYEGN